MKIPLQITYRGLRPSLSIENTIGSRAAWLDKYHPALISCRVAVEIPHRRHRNGSLYRVRIDMTVPRAELVAGRHPDEREEHADFYVALRDAFRAARRVLEDDACKRRHQVKTHRVLSWGVVSGLFRDRGFGFLRSSDDRDVYFHENSVAGGLDALAPGTLVRFLEATGEKGPQATIVKPDGGAPLSNWRP